MTLKLRKYSLKALASEQDPQILQNKLHLLQNQVQNRLQDLILPFLSSTDDAEMSPAEHFLAYCLEKLRFGTIYLVLHDKTALASVYIGRQYSTRNGAMQFCGVPKALKETLPDVLTDAFEDYGFRKVKAEVFDYETEEFLQSCGFTTTGVSPAETLRQGNWADSIQLEILNPAWAELGDTGSNGTTRRNNAGSIRPVQSEKLDESIWRRIARRLSAKATGNNGAGNERSVSTATGVIAARRSTEQPEGSAEQLHEQDGQAYDCRAGGVHSG